MLLEDMAASAAEYEQRGWTTLGIHTADVTVLSGEYGDRVGLSVLAPDDEFADLESMLADGVDGFEAYRTTAMGYVALLVVLEDAARERAVLVPAYYSREDDDAETLFGRALDEGELTLYLRNLAEEYVEVSLSDPRPLAPPDADENASAADDSQ